MTALQASIGALNDVVDVAADAGRKPGKPIPAGLVTPRTARVVVIGAAVAGLALAAPSGLGLVAIATIGLAVGYAYDLRAKGTAWSWLPFVVGIPLLPLFGWYGAAGTVPGWFIALLPLAALAGAAVAIANARADVERDLAAGRTSVAVRLGLEGSWWAGAALTCLAVCLAIATLAVGGGAGEGEWALVVAGTAVLVVGVALGWRGDPGRRERAWEIQAVGLAVLGVGWVVAVAT